MHICVHVTHVCVRTCSHNYNPQTLESARGGILILWALCPWENPFSSECLPLLGSSRTFSRHGPRRFLTSSPPAPVLTSVPGPISVFSCAVMAADRPASTGCFLMLFSWIPVCLANLHSKPAVCQALGWQRFIAYGPFQRSSFSSWKRAI